MSLKKLPSECIAPLRLREITLHGIGSYLRPARLEIRPLTILCGPNGCGKSIWIRSLDLLARSADDETFPLSLVKNENAALLYNSTAADVTDDRWPVPDWDSPFGPLGSIGMTLDCVKPVSLTSFESLGVPDPNHVRSGLPSELRRGDTIRLRWTCQYHGWGSKAKRFLALRVTVNGIGTEWRAARTPVAKASGFTGLDYDVRGSLWQVRDAPSKTGRGHAKRVCERELTEGTTETLESLQLGALSNAYRKAVLMWRQGYFRISAVRQIQMDEGVLSGGWEPDEVEDASLSRWVGAEGQRTHLLANSYQFNAMLDPRPGRPYLCAPSVADSAEYPVGADADDAELFGLLRFPESWQWLVANKTSVWLTLVSLFQNLQGRLQPDNEKLVDLAIRLAGAAKTKVYDDLAVAFAQDGLDAIWPESGAERRKRLAEIANESKYDGIDLLFGTSMKFVVEGTDRARFRDAIASIVTALQDLYRSDMFLEFYLSLAGRRHHNNPPLELPIPDFMKFAARQPKEQLCEYEKWYLRYWAIREIGKSSVHGLLKSYRLDGTMRVWLWRLFEMRKKTEDDGEDEIPDSGALTAGFLCRYKPEIKERDERGVGHACYANAFTGGSLKQFSSGVHQVLPMLVQCNLMKMNELCAVENPEVHLHPNLQIKCTEFFIENAKIGKFCLLETHSDLLIRRVLRATMEEDIRQSWVGIWFIHDEETPEYMETRGDMPHTSVMECLRVEHGRIDNWPDGFLADDTHEASRMVRTLYGRGVRI